MVITFQASAHARDAAHTAFTFDDDDAYSPVSVGDDHDFSPADEYADGGNDARCTSQPSALSAPAAPQSSWTDSAKSLFGWTPGPAC